MDLSKNERYKYLQGTLFTVGGLLKIEAKSYLFTLKKEQGDKFHDTCPLFNEENPIDQAEQQRIRELKKHDKIYFQTDFVKEIVSFIQTIS